MAIGALLLSAGAGVPFFHVWPRPDNPSLDQTGSPGVTRDGSKLTFAGALPWTGHYPQGKDRAGHRVSFGDAPPHEEPEPASWEHYAPDSVILHSAKKGTITFTPEEFERNARLGYFVITFVQNLIIATVFFFVVSMLLRFKQVDPRTSGPLKVLARCLIPACVYCAILMMIGTPLAGTPAVSAFLLVMAMNAFLFVLGAGPATEEEEFAV